MARCYLKGRLRDSVWRKYTCEVGVIFEGSQWGSKMMVGETEGEGGGVVAVKESVEGVCAVLFHTVWCPYLKGRMRDSVWRKYT